MEALDLILTIGLTARLTRLAVYDSAGEIIRKPIFWAASKLTKPTSRRLDWADELLGCPFCVGFWMAVAAASSWAVAGHTIAWTAIALAGTASYVAGHLTATLDDDRYRSGGW